MKNIWVMRSFVLLWINYDKMPPGISVRTIFSSYDSRAHGIQRYDWHISIPLDIQSNVLFIMIMQTRMPKKTKSWRDLSEEIHNSEQIDRLESITSKWRLSMFLNWTFWTWQEYWLVSIRTLILKVTKIAQGPLDYCWKLRKNWLWSSSYFQLPH